MISEIKEYLYSLAMVSLVLLVTASIITLVLSWFGIIPFWVTIVFSLIGFGVEKCL